jgi:hypothetical protein
MDLFLYSFLESPFKKLQPVPQWFRRLLKIYCGQIHQGVMQALSKGLLMLRWVLAGRL